MKLTTLTSMALLLSTSYAFTQGTPKYDVCWIHPCLQGEFVTLLTSPGDKHA
jgi:hypothetical protein